MVLPIVSETMEAELVPTLDPFLGIRAGAQPTAGAGEGGKRDRVMSLDRPCSITTSNITSFNLYSTSIDPSGCYHAAIAAQVWARLSFGGAA